MCFLGSRASWKYEKKIYFASHYRPHIDKILQVELCDSHFQKVTEQWKQNKATECGDFVLPWNYFSFQQPVL